MAKPSKHRSARVAALAATIATLALATPALAQDGQWGQHGGGHSGGQGGGQAGGGSAPAGTSAPAHGNAPAAPSGGGRTATPYGGAPGGWNRQPPAPSAPPPAQPPTQPNAHPAGAPMQPQGWQPGRPPQPGTATPQSGHGGNMQGWGNPGQNGHDANDRRPFDRNGSERNHDNTGSRNDWHHGETNGWQGQYRPGPHGNYPQWGHEWRRDQRYDWRGWRNSNRDAFHVGRYYPPYRGYFYNRLSIGIVLDPLFWGDSYWIYDPWYYHLPAAGAPYRWIRYYDDAMLIDTVNGQVVDVIYDFFW